MRLDAALRDFITTTWVEPADRKAVVELLGRLDESCRPSMVMAREVGAPTSIEIASWVLVVTRDAIGYGWPMREVIWLRAAEDRPPKQA